MIKQASDAAGTLNLSSQLSRLEKLRGAELTTALKNMGSGKMPW